MAKSVTTGSAALIYNPVGEPAGSVVTIRALSGATHYIGQSGVTTSTGLPMGAGDELVLHQPPVALYAVNAASGTIDVTVSR